MFERPDSSEQCARFPCAGEQRTSMSLQGMAALPSGPNRDADAGRNVRRAEPLAAERARTLATRPVRRWRGPNQVATAPVPRDRTAKSMERTARVTGSTQGVTVGVTTSRPSTAESTEIVGVMTASPKNRAAPAAPSRKTKGVRRPIAPSTPAARADRRWWRYRRATAYSTAAVSRRTSSAATARHSSMA